MTPEEFEQAWKRAKARDAKLEEEWNALSEEEKKRHIEKYGAAFIERITDDITGGHDDQISVT